MIPRCPSIENICAAIPIPPIPIPENNGPD
jgi:hypothetical protein